MNTSAYIGRWPHLGHAFLPIQAMRVQGVVGPFNAPPKRNSALGEAEGKGIFDRFVRSLLNREAEIVRKEFPTASGDFVRSHVQPYHWMYEFILPGSASRKALEGLFEYMTSEVGRELDAIGVPKDTRNEDSSKKDDFHYSVDFMQLGEPYRVTVRVYTGGAKFIHLVAFRA